MKPVPNDISYMEAAVLLMKSQGAKLKKVSPTAFYFEVPKQSVLRKNPVRLAQCGRIFNELLGCKLLIKK